MQQLQNIDPNKIFLVNFSELEGRWDVQFYHEHFNFESFIRLSSIAKVSGGKRLPLGKDYANEATSFLYLRVADIQDNGLIDLTTLKFIDEETYNELKRYEIFNGDLAISIAGTIGKVVVIKGITENRHVILTENCAKILHRDSVLSEYLQLLLLLPIVQKQIELSYIQTTIPKLGLDRISSLMLPKIPSKDIQQAIVDHYKSALLEKFQKDIQAKTFLNSIDDYLLGELGIVLPNKDAYYVDFCAEPQVEYGIHKKNELDENNKLVREGKMFLTSFKEISGKRLDPFYYQNKYKIIEDVIDNLSDKCRLGDVIVNLSNGIEVRDYVENGYRYLRVTDLGEHELSNASSKYININGIPNRVKLNTNCILVSRSGSLGLVNEVNADMLDYVLSSHIFKVELDTKRINPKYAVEILRNKICQNQIFRNNNGGIIPEIQQNALKSIKIPLPPLEKQQKIVDHITAIRQQAKALQEEGKTILEDAKKEVERIILGNE